MATTYCTEHPREPNGYHCQRCGLPQSAYQVMARPLDESAGARSVAATMTIEAAEDEMERYEIAHPEMAVWIEGEEVA